MAAKSIMIQGTGSHVGKSVLVAALCRIFKQDGYRVAPFKSQNMALNSYVTADGGEMGRAQVVQAEAAGIPPTVDMNPILLKPTGDMGSQVILRGKPLSNMTAREYYEKKTGFLEIIRESFERLREQYDVIVIEGAGSPAEVNLRASDIANMRVAEMAEAPVLLITDIDRGGAFAWLVGTLILLTPPERERVGGFVINKFRGDLNLLKPGLDFLERKTGKRVVGVLPYFRDIRVDEEDSVALEYGCAAGNEGGVVDVAVIRVPRISNFTDFDPLATEEGVSLRYVEGPETLGEPDLIILPGSKNTIEDLVFLKRTGLYDAVLERAGDGKTMVVGICGGFQMLGRRVSDPQHTESDRGEMEGFGLLDVVTELEPEKITHQVEFRALRELPFYRSRASMMGYEIHMGRTRLLPGVEPLFGITRRSGRDVYVLDGAISPDGRIWGTYIHGIFDNDEFRRELVDHLRRKRGLTPGIRERGRGYIENKQENYDRLADWARKNLDMRFLYDLLFNR
ncbi:MAG: cobyric acid synthase [bacterium]